MSLFEVASRKKYRFQTKKGLVGVEDLWDLPLQSKDGFNLDVLAVSLSDKLEDGSKSFVNRRMSENTDGKNKLDIVVHVINTKIEESKAREKAAENKEEREKLLGILKTKQDEALGKLSEDDIKKRIEALS